MSGELTMSVNALHPLNLSLIMAMPGFKVEGSGLIRYMGGPGVLAQMVEQVLLDT